MGVGGVIVSTGCTGGAVTIGVCAVGVVGVAGGGTGGMSAAPVDGAAGVGHCSGVDGVETGGTGFSAVSVSGPDFLLHPAMRSTPSNTKWMARMAKTVIRTWLFPLSWKVPCGTSGLGVFIFNL